MKKKNLLVLLLVFIGVLAIGVYIVKSLPEDDGVEETTTTSTISIISKESSDVAKIEVINEYGAEVYYKDEEDVWTSEREPTAYINTSVLERMAVCGSDIDATAKVQDSKSNLGVYGLDEPAHTVILTYNDGSEVTFYIGMQNQVTQEYYFMADDVDGIYAVAKTFPGYFNFSLSDIMMYEDINMVSQTNDLQEMAVSYDDNKWHIIRYDEGSVHDVSGVRAWYMLGLFEHETAIDTTYLEDIQTYFTEITGLELCVHYTATEEELATYGLNYGNEKGYLYYRYIDSTSVLLQELEAKVWLGNKTEDGEYYYVRPDGRDGVYLMYADTIDGLLAYKEEELLQKYISVVNVSTIDSYSVKMEDVDYTANVVASGEADNPVYTHYHNNKAIEKTGATSFYSSLIEIYAEKGYIEKEASSGEPVLTVTFNRNTENIPVYEVTFYEHSVSYYKVAINGEISYLVNARDFKALKETITNFVSAIPYAE